MAVEGERARTRRWNFLQEEFSLTSRLSELETYTIFARWILHWINEQTFFIIRKSLRRREREKRMKIEIFSLVFPCFPISLMKFYLATGLFVVWFVTMRRFEIWGSLRVCQLSSAKPTSTEKSFYFTSLHSAPIELSNNHLIYSTFHDLNINSVNKNFLWLSSVS